MKSHFLTAVLFTLIAATSLVAAEYSPALPDQLASAGADEEISVIAFLDNRVEMDEVYPEARALPMKERREFVVTRLKERFAQMSPRVMGFLDLQQKSGGVTLFRPLWVMNAIRLSAKPEVIHALSAQYSEVTYIMQDPEYDNTLDIGWGVFESQAPETWLQYGARGQGVLVGHKDSGINHENCARFAGRIWVNSGEDLNGNGTIDGAEENNVDDDGNGYADDFYGWNFDFNSNDVQDNDPIAGGHGTRTASVISSNFGTGTSCDTVAMAPEATLMILRGFRSQGAVYEASQYGIEMGAQVFSASLSFKQSNCTSSSSRDCPARVCHRWVSEMELAAGIIHSNSTGNEGLNNPRPMSTSSPSDCPPPAMTDAHWQQGGVSSIVSVAGYNADGTYYSSSGRGPAAWSRQDICVQPRMPFCAPEGFPGEYPDEFEDYPYANGNHGLLKPDVSSPTSVEAVSTSCTCSSIGGTSGATPHVGGALAVILSAFPGISPEDAYLVLVNGCLDAGDPGPDSTWGFGKLRLLPAVQGGHGSLGSVAGTVSSSVGGALEGVRISIEDHENMTRSAGDGSYEIFLAPGTYTGRYEKFGYGRVLRNIAITSGQVDDGNLTLTVANAANIEITVLDPIGNPVSNISVAHPISGQVEFTDALGQADFTTMYDGEQIFVVGENFEHFAAQAVTLQLLPGQNSHVANLNYSDYVGATGPDAYGYFAYDDLDFYGPVFTWTDIRGAGAENLGLSGDGSTVRTLPFNMTFYGQDYGQICISANGHVEMGAACTSDWSRWPIPVPGAPDNYIAVFWQDYRPELGGGVWYLDDSDNHRVIIQWQDVPEYFETGTASFQLVIYNPIFNGSSDGNSMLEMYYGDYEGRLETSVGIEGPDGTQGLLYSFGLFYSEHSAPIHAGRAIMFTTDELIAADNTVEIPSGFELLQNYPNPFNARTTFQFAVPQVSRVKLELFDITGRLAATLVDDVQSAGLHRVTFDGKSLASGVYIARMIANGNPVEARKVLLLK